MSKVINLLDIDYIHGDIYVRSKKYIYTMKYANGFDVSCFREMASCYFLPFDRIHNEEIYIIITLTKQHYTTNSFPGRKFESIFCIYMVFI